MLRPFARFARRIARRTLGAAGPELASLPGEVWKLGRDFDRLRMLVGVGQAARVRQLPDGSPLREAEFAVFSQWGEDGIIEYLVSRIDVPVPTFVEFGVEDYRESNTRFLLSHRNWRGLVIDGSIEHVGSIRNSWLTWQHDLTATHAFVTAENINGLISAAGISGDIGLLSVDIDGNDYWVWKAISVVRPRIVICEYNGVFGPAAKVTVPYDPAFTRFQAHHSNQLWGASLNAFCDLAAAIGYVFVGSNTAGSNAFFVREDCAGRLRRLTAAEGYMPSRFRDSRDEAGQLTFASGDDRLKLILDCQVVDLTTQSVRRVGDAMGTGPA